jgi:hypothetical protein
LAFPAGHKLGADPTRAEVPTGRLRDMIYPYPTFHRVIETSVADHSPVSQGIAQAWTATSSTWTTFPLGAVTAVLE